MNDRVDKLQKNPAQHIWSAFILSAIPYFIFYLVRKEQTPIPPEPEID